MGLFKKRSVKPNGKKIMERIAFMPPGEVAKLSAREGEALRSSIMASMGATSEQTPPIDGAVVCGHVVKITH